MFLLPKAYLQIKTTKNKGRGVFAKKDIEPGMVVGDYLGTFIREKEEDAYEEKYGFYTMYYHDNASIFPDTTTEGIHLINHSCAPNCYMYTYKGHTLYFTLRKIFKGEELNVSYLISPLEDDDCDPCIHPCMCGSEQCSGSMHVEKKIYDKWSAFDDKQAKKFILPRVKYGTAIEALSSYPKKIRDHTIYPVFGSYKEKPLLIKDKKILSKSAIRKLIRETGRRLYFKNLHLIVLGISDNQLLQKTLSQRLKHHQ